MTYNKQSVAMTPQIWHKIIMLCHQEIKKGILQKKEITHLQISYVQLKNLPEVEYLPEFWKKTTSFRLGSYLTKLKFCTMIKIRR